MKNLAIIPARGGSKRIPRKNIKDFLGKKYYEQYLSLPMFIELPNEEQVFLICTTN